MIGHLSIKKNLCQSIHKFKDPITCCFLQKHKPRIISYQFSRWHVACKATTPSKNSMKIYNENELSFSIETQTTIHFIVTSKMTDRLSSNKIFIKSSEIYKRITYLFLLKETTSRFSSTSKITQHLLSKYNSIKSSVNLKIKWHVIYIHYTDNDSFLTN